MIAPIRYQDTEAGLSRLRCPVARLFASTRSWCTSGELSESRLTMYCNEAEGGRCGKLKIIKNWLKKKNVNMWSGFIPKVRVITFSLAPLCHPIFTTCGLQKPTESLHWCELASALSHTCLLLYHTVPHCAPFLPSHFVFLLFVKGFGFRGAKYVRC